MKEDDYIYCNAAIAANKYPDSSEAVPEIIFKYFVLSFASSEPSVVKCLELSRAGSTSACSVVSAFECGALLTWSAQAARLACRDD